MFELYTACRFIPTRKNRRRHDLNQKITCMLRSLIERKEKTMQMAGEDNLLSLLFKSNNDNSRQHNSLSNTKCNQMTMDEIIEECKQFYLAGHETTSSWLTWTVIVLAMHQDWQQKAREEVLILCKDKDPNADTINRLKIVSIFLFEYLIFSGTWKLKTNLTANTHTGEHDSPRSFKVVSTSDRIVPTCLQGK